MSAAAPTTRPAVPERFAWALTLLLAGGVLYAVIVLVTLVGDVANLAQWVEPDAGVPITMPVQYDLPTSAGTHVYGGGPYVADGQQITATEIATTVSGVALVDRILLGAAPVLTDLALLAVAWLLVLAVRRLRGGAGFGDDVAKPVVAAGVVLLVGSAAAGVVQGIANFRVMTFMWAAPEHDDGSLFRTTIVTVGFGPLFFAVALFAVALILRRGLALQRETEGLV